MDDGYSGGAVAGAVILTICFPLIALIVALLMQGGQTDPRKRSQLRTWAWASLGWMVFAFVLGVVLALVTA
jgi:fumarate reductase subunit D